MITTKQEIIPEANLFLHTNIERERETERRIEFAAGRIDMNCAIMQAHKTHSSAHVAWLEGWEIHKKTRR